MVMMNWQSVFVCVCVTKLGATPLVYVKSNVPIEHKTMFS